MELIALTENHDQSERVHWWKYNREKTDLSNPWRIWMLMVNLEGNWYDLYWDRDTSNYGRKVTNGSDVVHSLFFSPIHIVFCSQHRMNTALTCLTNNCTIDLSLWKYYMWMCVWLLIIDLFILSTFLPLLISYLKDLLWGYAFSLLFVYYIMFFLLLVYHD